MYVIESDEYRQERANLKKDPIILNMYADILDAVSKGTKLSEFMHPMKHEKDVAPRHGFMVAAMDHYREQGGTNSFSIGGPSRAILELVVETMRKADHPLWNAALEEVANA